MTYHFNERELDEAHARNQQHFATIENDLDSMHQTLSYQTEHLSQWVANYGSPELSKQIIQELTESRQAFEGQLNDCYIDLASRRSAEEGHYQNLSELLNLL